jgi:Holliday junction resolvasome RuvABC endonuclease subunit
LRILALDLAVTTGWAFGDNLASAHVGTWRLPGYADERIQQTLGSIYSAVNTICRGNMIEAVIIEAALRTIKKKNSRDVWTPTSAHGDRCLTMLNGAARAGAANAGVKQFEFPAPNTWRAAVYGEGYPKNPKAHALEYCRRNGRDIKEHDAAEALAILQYGIGKVGLLGRIKG